MNKNFKAEAEVKRLDQLKASMMKELFIKKQKELEDICNKSHMEIPSRSEMEKIINLINSGTCVMASMLENIMYFMQIYSNPETDFYVLQKGKLTMPISSQAWMNKYQEQRKKHLAGRL